MIARVIHWIRFLVWQSPARFIGGMFMFCVVGVLAGAGTSLWMGKWRKTEERAAEGLPSGWILLIACLADWALLQALPLLRLSFSAATVLPLLASIVVRLAIFWTMMGATLFTRWRKRWSGIQIHARFNAVLFLALNLGLSAAQVDAYVVEPLWVETTPLSLASPRLDLAAPPIRVVHLSDMHIERNSYREAMVVKRVNALRPDIIVFTGDYLNLSRLDDPLSAAHFRQFVTQLRAPYGIYAVRGSVDPSPQDMASLIEGTNVIWLEQEALTLDVRGQRVTLIGIACSHDQDLDVARLNVTMQNVPADTFKLLLYHSPDLIDVAARHGIDLYLGGHTHGGQLRLPFYGALVTCSIYGKRYEAGLFQEGPTHMVISRGIGFEGGGMPRARFLCRPEIVSIELRGREEER